MKIISNEIFDESFNNIKYRNLYDKMSTFFNILEVLIYSDKVKQLIFPITGEYSSFFYKEKMRIAIERVEFTFHKNEGCTIYMQKRK
jgi:hypothetical protein